MYQEYSCPEDVTTIREFLLESIAWQGDPRLKVGINLERMSVTINTFDTCRQTYLLPVLEYTFTDPSCIATAANEVVAVIANTRDGR